MSKEALEALIKKKTGESMEVLVYTMVKDGEPYHEWTENGRTIRVGETVTIGWGSLEGQSGRILRFCSFRSDAFHVEVELSDGSKAIWPINAIVYASQEELNKKPGRWQLTAGKSDWLCKHSNPDDPDDNDLKHLFR